MIKPHVVFVFLILAISFLRVGQFVIDKKEYNNQEKISFTSLVFDSRENISYTRLTLKLPTGEDIYVESEKSYNYLDNVKATGTINIKLLNKDRYIFTLEDAIIEANYRENNLVLAGVSSVRQKIVDIFNSSLDIQSSSLILGVVFGIRDTMPKDFSDKLSTTGLLHVVAASGMNVTILAGVVNAFLAFFLKRKTALILSIVAIGIYCILSGLEPSIIRASIMGTIALFSRLIGRKDYALISLSVAASVMLLVSPILIFDIGFQLSFLATLGLIFIVPMFEGISWIRKYKRNPILESLFVTLSAQIATLPIILNNFGSFSLISIPANILALWSVPFIMVLGAIGAVIGLFVKAIGVFFLYLSLPFVIYFRFVVDLIYTDMFSFEILLTWPFVVSYYLILSSFIIFHEKRRGNEL